MNERTRKQAVYAVFVLAVLFGLYMKPWDRHQGAIDAPADSSGDHGITTPAAAAGADSAQVPGAAVFATEWPSDPFAHRGQTASAGVVTAPWAEPTMPAFTLQGMMQLGGQAACVINGEILKAGDRISGWTVESISATDAVLRLGSERQRLRIN
jgi:hypothetical protein